MNIFILKGVQGNFRKLTFQRIRTETTYLLQLPLIGLKHCRVFIKKSFLSRLCKTIISMRIIVKKTTTFVISIYNFFSEILLNFTKLMLQQYRYLLDNSTTVGMLFIFIIIIIHRVIARVKEFLLNYLPFRLLIFQVC